MIQARSDTRAFSPGSIALGPRCVPCKSDRRSHLQNEWRVHLTRSAHRPANASLHPRPLIGHLLLLLLLAWKRHVGHTYSGLVCANHCCGRRLPGHVRFPDVFARHEPLRAHQLRRRPLQARSDGSRVAPQGPLDEALQLTAHLIKSVRQK